MVMISFIFFPGKLAVEQGVSYEYYLRSLTMMHEMVSKAQRRLCSLIVVTDEEKDELLQQQNDNINSLEIHKKSRQAIIGD
jgi:hypothetical protein